MPRFVPALACSLALFVCHPVRAAASPPAQPNNPFAVNAYARVLHTLNPQMPLWQRRDLARHMLINARRWKLDASLLVALVGVESSWHTHAISNAGALGLGQLMPGTAQLLRVNPDDPYENLQGAARYLHGLLARFYPYHNRYALAFAAYNAGPKAVERFGGIPPYSQTQRYVVKVMAMWERVTASVHIRKDRRRRIDAAVAALRGAPDVMYWAGTHK